MNLLLSLFLVTASVACISSPVGEPVPEEPESSEVKSEQEKPSCYCMGCTKLCELANGEKTQGTCC